MKTKHANNYLKTELERRLEANPHYSLRSFAKYLGLSPGVVSEILNNKRAISLKMALKISKGLEHKPVERGYFLDLVNKDLGMLDDEVEIPSRNVTADIFDVVSDWYHFAILNLSECVDFRWSFSWIGKRLGISMLVVKSAIEKLMRVQLIKQKGEGYEATHEWVQSPDGIPSEAIRKYHKSILEKAKDSLDFQKINERDISGVGFAFDPNYVSEIKKDIQSFQERMLKKYSKGNKTEVYQLEIALFRLTNEVDK